MKLKLKTRSIQLGVVNSTLTGIELLRKDKGGKGGLIVNLASEAGIRTGFTLPIYCGTKHAVTGFTRSLANRAFFKRTGVSFITVCPGVTDTAMTKNFRDKFLFPEMFPDLERLKSTITEQPTSVVGDCVVRALADGENGAVWACANNVIRKVKVTEYPDFENAAVLNDK